ncbi:MAG: class I tRNA ligase family protein, partial [Bryobacteraceae bacterium]|nr:class I tRNA ligase family protein [Bryobacteraceae bacterium]
ALLRLMAPLLTFTTEEAWGHFPRKAGDPDSVHLTRFPEPDELSAGLNAEQQARLANWDKLLPVRDQVLKALEVARQEKFIGAPLEARVRLKAGANLYPLLEEYRRELPALFIVSQVLLENHAEAELEVHVERAAGVKCERCWKYSGLVGAEPAYPTVCDSCAAALKEIVG